MNDVKVHFAVGAVFWLVFAAAGAAQSVSTAAPDPVSQQPAENRDNEFHSPLPAAAVENRDAFRNQYLFGDWMGARTALAERGIRFNMLFIADPFGNVTGGERRGASDYNLLGFGVTLRTDQLLGWRGGQFHVGFAVNFGNSLTKNYVGNAFPIQLADVADTHPRLTYLSYTQSLLDDKLSIRLGRTTINSVAGEEFMGSRYFKAFTSVGVDLVPLGPFLNAPGAFGYPDTTWGARIKFAPVKRFYAMVGAYNGDPALKQGARHGLDFSLHGPLFVIGEFGLRGSSGNLKFGGYDNAGTANTFLSPPDRPRQTSSDRRGVYVVGDHVLLRFGDPSQDRHLGLFGAFTAAADQRVNPFPYFFDTGLVMYGPSRRRPKDFIGFAAVYGSYSSDLRRAEEIQPTSTGVQRFETVLELNYGWTIRPGLLLQPDLQYIVHPNGNERLPNALAIGLNIVINL
jgi:porin